MAQGDTGLGLYALSGEGVVSSMGPAAARLPGVGVPKPGIIERVSMLTGPPKLCMAAMGVFSISYRCEKLATR